MKKLILAICLIVTSAQYTQAEELEFVGCGDQKMTCMNKQAFLSAIYTVQAAFGVVNAICLVAPEPVVTKSIVAINAGIGVANVILRNIPCTEDGELNETQREEVAQEVCRLTGGDYDPTFDKCVKN